MRGEHLKAIEMYNKAIQIDPLKASVYINRGIGYNMSGDLQRSLKDMDKAVNLDRKPMHLLYRGIAHKLLGDKVAAKADFEAVLQMEPGNKAAMEQLKTLN